jgi:glycosyltransferase involved in cell wall biosynthesis
VLLVDATPLQSEHRLRGVGVHLRQLIGALEKSPGDGLYYLVSTVGKEPLAALPHERLIYTTRYHQPAQVYWFYSELAFRPLLWRHRPKVFLATDFNGLVANPFGKTFALHYDLTALKLGTAGLPTLSSRLSDLRWQVYIYKLKRADGIITISHSAKADLVSLLGIPAEKIRVVHLGVDHSRFYPATGHGRFASAPPYLVHVGGCNVNKNQARLLQAFDRVAREHRDLHLYLVGPWHATDLEWLET